MLKKLSIILGVIVLLFFSTGLVQAQFGLQGTASRAQYQEGDIYSTLSTVISVVLIAIGIVFLTIMIYAGLRWMTARGNETFIEKAKEAMFGAIMGLILVTVSYALSAFIFSRLIK